MATLTESNFRVQNIHLQQNEAGEWTVTARVETVTAAGEVVREVSRPVGFKFSAQAKTEVANVIKAARLAIHELLGIPGTE